ncbi:major facilitator superfamily transporter [Trichosporon asahii var. asahii CBS 8904]|uniref:Major facilitator superfamily transporter n=1 Tax=Trichosporon asahii var. asahii (strain CBS 8904) TaxID=1220162 RepID=K1VKG8_TRIAC|nr:major facilitator superfamily transporter [Trichosporon asahii var. asahii CBS 8904]
MATNVLSYDQRKDSTSKYDDDIDVKVAEAGGDDPRVDYSGFAQKTDPVEIKLVRKLDLFIMYQTAVSILFAGYVIFGVPSNMLITRVKPSLYLCLVMLTWSVLSICTSFTKNFGQLCAVRFLLGCTEAPYYPGALFLISNFYTRTEVATRIAILYTGNVLATAFAGLIAAGVFHMDGMLGYAGWQWLFIIRDNVDRVEAGSTWQGLKQAVVDPRVWIFALMFNMHLSANGFKNFFPSKTVAIIGFALAPATLNTGVRYFAMMVFTLGTYGVNSLILGWASTVCSQTPEKKAVVIAMLTTAGNASFIYTPYLFREQDKPRYTLAMVAMAAFSLGTLLCGWVMRIILKRQNRTLAETGAPTKYPY